VNQHKVGQEALAADFELHRPRLRAVAYRMLGSLSDADDAVQESWLRLSKADADAVESLPAWLTTVVSRVCIDRLRARKSRREESLEFRMPDPVLTDPDHLDPEQEAFLADSVGLAMLIVLDELRPAERLAFVLHDMFALPFAEIAPIVERSVEATKMLASRARRRVQSARVEPDADLARQRAAAEAFQAAARQGDFDALLQVLDPDVVLRNASADGLVTVRGATAVASGASAFQRLEPVVRPVLVNGAVGVVAIVDGEPFSMAAFTVVDGRIVAIDILTDRDRLRAIGVER
jgi:RNA polymerase sigma-70 factor (ECF subfamily)